MTAWPGKYVIGLTGNIATGKSVVRKMLEHLGAYGIDADALGHRAIAKGAPGYQSVVDTFGRWILAPDGQIDRAKLARLVFSNPEALSSLEEIVHPLVRQAVDVLARRAKQEVIVIEAIKLLEGNLHPYCDAIWVTHAPKEVQLSRLIRKRGMSEEVAWQRINAQSPQEDKLQMANVVIQNEKSFEHTWKQVLVSWQKTVTAAESEPEIERVATTLEGDLHVQRAGPQQAAQIAEFITQMSRSKRRLSSEDIMEAFGEKAFLLLLLDKRTVGLLGWQVENLVARIDDVYLRSDISAETAMQAMMEKVEQASRELQCEAALLFLPSALAQQEAVWQRLDYQIRAVKDLGVRAWQDAARESMPPNTVMLFKQLRKDRVLRPV
jgi:dephospho-CoA kinase